VLPVRTEGTTSPPASFWNCGRTLRALAPPSDLHA
jgi:hypothetical protein